MKMDEGNIKIVSVSELIDARDVEYACSCVYATFRARGYSPCDGRKLAERVVSASETGAMNPAKNE